MNKKGFTLVELLAVTVILAVIALISTPLITNTIATVRKNADRESARSYFATVEEKITEAAMEYPNIVIGTGDGDTVVTAADDMKKWACTECSASNYVDIEFKGTVPRKRLAKYDQATGKLTGKVKYNNWCGEMKESGDLKELPASDDFCK